MHSPVSGRSRATPAVVRLAVAVVFALVGAAPVRADGFIIPIPPPKAPDLTAELSVKYHRVQVSIGDQIAQTAIDQVFLNPSPYELEGTYIFPLPEDAAISDFAMFVDGQRTSGKVLNKYEARRIYEDIVRRRRDPAILEYLGRNAFQASIYPIPAHGEKRVQLSYSQVLVADRGLFHYVYPLSTERFSSRPLDEVTITIELQSTVPVRAIYSPSHEVSILRDGEFSALISFEANDVRPDRDFELYYSVSEGELGFNVLSYREADEDGYFLMLIAPPLENRAQASIPKDVIFVLDTSGSMQGNKLQQAKEALRFVLDRLQPSDRFGIITFNSVVTAFSDTLEPPASRDEAWQFVRDLSAAGGTNIHRALTEALTLSKPGRPQFVIFLTDGLPTVGVTDVADIIHDVAQLASHDVRLFAFGVGYDVNTLLLDTISQEHRGTSSYVEPDQNLEEEVSAFYSKISSPVLTDLRLSADGARLDDLYPYPLPDLFAGTQLLVVGRYRTSGTVSITLEGALDGKSQRFLFPATRLTELGGQDSVALLWATRKVGYLLREIRLKGENPELVEELISLSIRYGIMTPYTSFLVDEDEDILTADGRSGLAFRSELNSPQVLPFSGAKAVADSQMRSELSLSEHGGGMQTTEVKWLGGKALVRRDGIWTDTTYDPAAMAPKVLTFGSTEYFALLAAHPECGKYFALGQEVIVVLGGTAYSVAPQSGPAVADAPTQPRLPWPIIRYWWNPASRE